MSYSGWNTTVLRSLSHSLQAPNVVDLRVNTYSALIQSLMPGLPDDFLVEDVEQYLKKAYGFSNVSKLLISKSLILLSRRDPSKKEEIMTFNKSDFTLPSEGKKPFNELVEMLISKISLHGMELDDYQKILVENLLECTLFQMSEALDDVIASFYNGKSCLNDQILTEISSAWRENLKRYDCTYIERFDKISAVAIDALKSLFTEKDRIGEFLGIIGQILVYRGFVCADPELKKLTRDIFSKTFLLIDTNVLISYLCQGSLSNDEVVWLLDSCKDIGIQIKILEDTKSEYERTLLKDTVRHSLLRSKEDADLLFGERDIPLGYSNKWYRLGSWNKYIKYLEEGPDNFLKKLNGEIVKTEISEDVYRKAYLRVQESVRMDKYKEPNAIKHDARLIASGHKIRQNITDPPFPSFVLTREKKLVKVESILIEKDGVLNPPPMVVSTDNLIEFLLPFFCQTEDATKTQTILGKMLSNTVINVDKKIFHYLLDYLAIETNLGEEGAKKLMELALDEYTLDKLILEREDQPTSNSNIDFINTLIAGIKKSDETEELNKKLVRLINLAKTVPGKEGTVPKIQSSAIGHLSRLFTEKLPIFLDPKPNDEVKFQGEMYKLMRAHDYKPNWNSDQVTFSTRGSKPDFTLNDEKIAIEAKYIGESTDVNDIVEQMAADCMLYSKNFDIIIFVVYDFLAKISDIEVFSGDFQKEGHVIIVIK